MAEELPSLHIDTDWKKQAQEEKRRLAEQQQQRAAAAAAPPAAAVPASPAGPPAGLPSAGATSSQAAPAGRGVAARRGSQLPQASFATLVQSLLTQAMFYLGELAPQSGEPTVNLDMAKHQLDTLAVLDEKTASHLSEDERTMLDTALYEARTRFVTVASQFIA